MSELPAFVMDSRSKLEAWPAVRDHSDGERRPGLSLPEHGYHAPNEYFGWRQASGGIKMLAGNFAEIA